MIGRQVGGGRETDEIGPFLTHFEFDRALLSVESARFILSDDLIGSVLGCFGSRDAKIGFEITFDFIVYGLKGSAIFRGIQREGDFLFARRRSGS